MWWSLYHINLPWCHKFLLPVNQSSSAFNSRYKHWLRCGLCIIFRKDDRKGKGKGLSLNKAECTTNSMGWEGHWESGVLRLLSASVQMSPSQVSMAQGSGFSKAEVYAGLSSGRSKTHSCVWAYCCLCHCPHPWSRISFHFYLFSYVNNNQKRRAGPGKT